MSNKPDKNLPFIWELLDPSKLELLIYSNEDISNLFFDELIKNDYFPLWDNINFIKKIININGEYLACASERLRKDYNICFEALKNSFKAKQYIDSSIKNQVVTDYLDYMKDDIKRTKYMRLKTGLGRKDNCREEIYSEDSNRPIKRTRTYEKDLCNLTTCV